MNMTIRVIIKGKIDSKGLYFKLAKYEPNVTDLDDRTYVCIAVNIKEDDVLDIISTCLPYGDCDIETHYVLPL